ncbi:MAG: hypothetical protein ACI9NT_002636 [Bacteroidia bacterium]|jgi:hypothetical protein
MGLIAVSTRVSRRARGRLSYPWGLQVFSSFPIKNKHL